MIADCKGDFKGKSIRIWNFNCQEVYIKLNNDNINQISFLYAHNYLFISNEYILKIIDFKRGMKILNSYYGEFNISSIEYINHPFYGSCIIILENDKIKLLKIPQIFEDLEDSDFEDNYFFDDFD